MRAQPIQRIGYTARSWTGHHYNILTQFSIDTMTDCKLCVDAGVCKMKTIIKATSNEMGMVELDIKSDCPNILRMTWKMEAFSPYTEVESEFYKSEVYKLAQETPIPHTACPVPSAMIKAIEVAGDLGLKRDVTIRFIDDEEED